MSLSHWSNYHVILKLTVSGRNSKGLLGVHCTAYRATGSYFRWEVWAVITIALLVRDGALSSLTKLDVCCWLFACFEIMFVGVI